MLPRARLDAFHEHLNRAFDELSTLLDDASPAERDLLASVSRFLCRAADELAALARERADGEGAPRR